jgi:hypothetical protein
LFINQVFVTFIYTKIQNLEKQKKQRSIMTTLLIAVILTGWMAAAVIGTQAYFLGEQTKPIHDRNLKSASFEVLAKTFTGKDIDYSDRVPAFALDTYTSNNLTKA